LAWVVALGLATLVLAALVGAAASRLILPGVAIEGTPVGGMTLEAAGRRVVPRLAALVGHPCYLRTPDGIQRVQTGEIGLAVDLRATLAAAYAPGHRGPWRDCLRAWLTAGREPVPVRVVLSWREKAFSGWLAGLQEAYAVQPVEAGWVVRRDGRVDVTPASVGRDVRSDVLRRSLERAALGDPGGRTVRLPLGTVHPVRGTAQALALGVHEVEARYRTYFNHRDANRSANVRLAAAAIDQVALAPGGVFSFNRQVGPRLPDSGYREAPVVVNGRLVPGVGGGVCQVSSTLYNAVLLADLDVVTRHRHSIPSAYVPPGRDATVAYDYFDFRFRNTRDWPVVVDTEVGPGWLETRILGRRQPEVRVEVRSEILETYRPDVEEVPEPGLPAGQRLVKAKGAPGFRVKVWQVIYRDGVEAERRLVSQDIYQPLKALILVGTGTEAAHPLSAAPQEGQPGAQGASSPAAGPTAEPAAPPTTGPAVRPPADSAPVARQ
jgi:vancomycin resistance protein YoaR